MSSHNKAFSGRRLVLTLAAAAMLGAGSYLAFADSKAADAKASVTVKVDATPLPRLEGNGMSLAPVVKRVSPSVVKVMVRAEGKEVQGPVASPYDDPIFRHFFGPMVPDQRGNRRAYRTPPQQGLGSGVIVSADGYILTNNHVIDEADTVTVNLSDGREFSAKVVGKDAKTDIAVIKIDAKDLPAVTFASSEDVQVGDQVLAIGNPFGIGQTVTTGIVSATGRAAGIGLDYEDFIQTDAAINPGNSGGALVDLQGRLIGINTAILSRSGGFQGIGFAIPSDLARSIMDALVVDGKVTRGYLGVGIQELNPALAEQFGVKAGTKGVLVREVPEDGPAAKAGLESGDVIVALGGREIPDSQRLRFAVAAMRPGSEVEVRVLRDGQEKTFTLTVAAQPGEEKLASGRSDTGDDGVLDGVGVSDLTSANRREYEIPARIEGALVTQVDPSSASAEAGLESGDVILEINRKVVRSAEDAVRLTERTENPKTLLKVWSRGTVRFLVVDETGR
ncbi:MAG: DegQ family serine endoprotease [Opitutaceae bacterium]|nr:DegQ family serine endoprotease [Opitutaceae bacterium]